MSLSIREDVNKILGRKYNVEYEMANGKNTKIQRRPLRI